MRERAARRRQHQPGHAGRPGHLRDAGLTARGPQIRPGRCAPWRPYERAIPVPDRRPHPAPPRLGALLGRHADLRVVGRATTPVGRCAGATAELPDVILLDNHLPGVRGVDAITDLREASPASRVIMLTVSGTARTWQPAPLRHGARLSAQDHGRRPAGPGRAPRGQRRAGGQPGDDGQAGGGLVQSQGAPEPRTRARPGRPRSCRRARKLVLREIARGASNKEIARALDIAETTVNPCAAHPAQAGSQLARAGGSLCLGSPACRVAICQLLSYRVLLAVNACHHRGEGFIPVSAINCKPCFQGMAVVPSISAGRTPPEPGSPGTSARCRC